MVSRKEQELFDNIAFIIAAEHALASTGIASIELDLELPRGFIAKFKSTDFYLKDPQSPVNVGTFQIQAAIINDPDDAASIEIPSNRVDHDVIDDAIFHSMVGAAGINPQFELAPKSKKWDQESDIIAARNLRYNAQTDSANWFATPRFKGVYTLEEVTTETLLNLLVIL